MKNGAPTRPSWASGFARFSLRSLLHMSSAHLVAKAPGPVAAPRRIFLRQPWKTTSPLICGRRSPSPRGSASMLTRQIPRLMTGPAELATRVIGASRFWR